MKNLGVAYGLVGRHAEALQAYARATAEYAALGKHHETALPLANTGLELLALGRPGEALVVFDQAIEIFEDADDLAFAAQCRGDAAQAHRQLGQVGEALRLLEEARDTLDRLGAATEAVRLRLALAQTHLAVGLWGEARDAASTAAIDAARSGLRHDEAKARFLLSLCDLAEERCAPALDELAAARDLFVEVDDQQHLARVALARAEALFRLGRTAAGPQTWRSGVSRTWRRAAGRCRWCRPGCSRPTSPTTRSRPRHIWPGSPTWSSVSTCPSSATSTSCAAHASCAREGRSTSPWTSWPVPWPSWSALPGRCPTTPC